MRLSDTTAGVIGFVWVLASSLLAQSWNLPQAMPVKDKGPRTYRFTMDHTVSDTIGRVVQRQRVSAEYTRGLPGGDAVWKRVTVAESNGPAEISGPGQPLKLNVPYRLLSAQDVNMPGVGTFQNRDVRLTWIGRSQRNGDDCAVIDYRAYFNPLEIANGGMTLKGRSHYWGEIWVSLTTKQIEYATLQEDVLGEMKLPGQDAARVINVFRSGVFEPVLQNQ
jgi:hypothetical protein